MNVRDVHELHPLTRISPNDARRPSNKSDKDSRGYEYAKIPKLGYYASYFGKEVKDALMEIYTHDIIKDGALYWSWESPYEVKRRSEMKTTFVYDYKRFVYITCYSSNLHIYGSEEVETTYSDETFGHHKRMNNFFTVIPEFDSFYPWTVPRILLSVHSPFVPIDPFDGELLEKNHEYFIKFRLALSINRESLRVQRCRILLKEFKAKWSLQWVHHIVVFGIVDNGAVELFQVMSGLRNGFSMVEEPADVQT
ncbi:hypothetical protein NPIL_516711, partial [Nephila pilipes]